ncbi:hypothetical protein HMPREF9120_01583 [Neisseria sp. oral taxon 020 str. F0370]|nr:hypothetical protein HMPREF9120_01583 [Neisseria sp. oral taxon 020 str. F0370]
MQKIALSDRLKNLTNPFQTISFHKTKHIEKRVTHDKQKTDPPCCRCVPAGGLPFAARRRRNEKRAGRIERAAGAAAETGSRTRRKSEAGRTGSQTAAAGR